MLDTLTYPAHIKRVLFYHMEATLAESSAKAATNTAATVTNRTEPARSPRFLRTTHTTLATTNTIVHTTVTNKKKIATAAPKTGGASGWGLGNPPMGTICHILDTASTITIAFSHG